MEKTIIILRHSAVNDYKMLSQEGRDTAYKAGEKIKALYPEVTFEVWSSPVERAVQTANLIAERISVSQVSESPIFGLYYKNTQNQQHEFSEFVSNAASEYLLIITHEPFFRDLAQQLGKEKEVIWYCEGVIMNENGSHFEYFKPEN